MKAMIWVCFTAGVAGFLFCAVVLSIHACDQSTTVSVPGAPSDTTAADSTACPPCPADTFWVQAPTETVWVVTVEPDSGWWPPGWRKNKK
jgi:hypothetical protein